MFQCWEWTGAKIPKGYGKLTVNGEMCMAHRIAYQFFNGRIPTDKIIRHSCDNPACCNPQHLLTGSYQENSTDMVTRKRSARGEDNARSKLTESQAAYVRRNPDGLTVMALAEKFGVAKSTISYVRSGRSWKYLVVGEGFEPPTPSV